MKRDKMNLKSTLERVYNFLDESQWWQQDKLVELQRGDLSRLIVHARSTTDFYRTRLDCLFRPDGKIDWDRWEDVPILTRAELSSGRSAIESRKPIQEHGPFGLVSTSGSTGDPVEFLTTNMLIEFSVASQWRSHKWFGIDWSDTMIYVGGSSAMWKTGDVMGPWGPYWMKDAAKGKRIFTDYFTPAAERLSLIQEYDASHAILTSGLAASLAEHLRKLNRKIKMKTAHFIGGAANEYIRGEVFDLMDANSLELYSSKEGGAMAYPCPLGQGWHQNAETVLLEIVDDTGRAVAPGQTGRVVITPFGSTATPLIRYDQGDLAVAGPTEICACGRTLPRIASISGRIRHYFFKPNGEVIANLSMKARIELGAGVWQVARVGEHSFEVRYQKRDWGVPPDLNAFRKSFAQDFYPEAQLKIIEVEKFDLGRTGKHLERVDEWKPQSQLTD